MSDVTPPIQPPRREDATWLQGSLRRIRESAVTILPNPTLLLAPVAALVALGSAVGRGPGDPAGRWAGCVAAILCLIPVAQAAVVWAVHRSIRIVGGSSGEGARRIVVRRVDPDGTQEEISRGSLALGDIVEVKAGEECPADGEIIEGLALAEVPGVDRPTLCARGWRRDVAEGTLLLAGTVKVRVSAPPGPSLREVAPGFLLPRGVRPSPGQRMVGAFLGLLSIPALACVACAAFCSHLAGMPLPLESLCALLVCVLPLCAPVLLHPLALHAGARLARLGLLARHQAAIEGAGAADWLVLDHDESLECAPLAARAIVAAPDVPRDRLLDAVQLCALADGACVVPDLLGLVRAERTIRWETFDIGSATFVRSTSDCASGFGVDLATDRFRIGPAAALAGFCEKPPPPLLMVRIRKIERAGERAWIVADAERVLGCVQLQEAPRRAPAALVRRLRVSGLKLMLVSTRRGTEARRLAEALGTDDFLSRAGPETKLALVARHRGAGRTIVVGGAGDAEARALEEASVGVLAAPRMPAPVGSADVLQLHGGSRHLLELARVGVEFQVVRGVVFGLALGTLLAQALVAIPAALAPLFPESPLLAALGFASAPRALAAAALYHPISFLLYFGLARIGLGRNDPRPDRRWRVNLFRYALAGALLTVAGTRLLDVFLAHIPIP